MSSDQIAIVLVGLLSLLGAVYSARSARRTNTVTVDVRIFEALQEDVVRLQERVQTLRAAVRLAEDDTDRERARRRVLAAQIEGCAELVAKMTLSLKAAGVPIPRVSRTGETNPTGYPQLPA